MKRRDLIQHLEEHGCRFDRRGGNHDIYLNPVPNRRACRASQGNPDVDGPKDLRAARDPKAEVAMKRQPAAFNRER
ncbi:MAG: hypothetical protein KJZ69_01300 [Phycisphaerales bacterium]|nr:hypothetical protein [Phycisphaerales bacterium]